MTSSPSAAKLRLLAAEKYDRLDVGEKLAEAMKRVESLKKLSYRMIAYMESTINKYKSADGARFVDALREAGGAGAVGSYFARSAVLYEAIQAGETKFREKITEVLTPVRLFADGTCEEIRQSHRALLEYRDAYDRARYDLQMCKPDLKEVEKFGAIAKIAKENLSNQADIMDKVLKKLPEYEMIIGQCINKCTKLSSEIYHDMSRAMGQLPPP